MLSITDCCTTSSAYGQCPAVEFKEVKMKVCSSCLQSEDHREIRNKDKDKYTMCLEVFQ